MADGGAVSVPVMMAIGGAVAGGAMDSENPLRGAALGAAGGYLGGGALGAMGASGAAGGAAGMGGAAGSGLSAAGGGLAGGAAGGMAAEGALGAGIAQGGGTGLAGAGGLLGGQGAGMAGAGAGVGMATPTLGMSAGQMAPSLSLAGHMGKLGAAMESPEMSRQLVGMGGNMLMKGQQPQQQQQPMPMPMAPPMMRPMGAAPSFMASAPPFRGVSNLPAPRNMSMAQMRGLM